MAAMAFGPGVGESCTGLRRTSRPPIGPASAERSKKPPPSASQCLARVCSIRSEEHTSELQSRLHLVCRLLLEKKKKKHSQIASLDHNKSRNVAHRVRSLRSHTE